MALDRDRSARRTCSTGPVGAARSPGTCCAGNRRTAALAALSDIRNAATAQEAYYAENKVYAGSVDRLILKLDLVKTPNVNLIINGNESGYTIISYHISGNKTYTLTGPDGTIQSN